MCMCMCVHVRACACMCACMCVHACVCMHACACACVLACMCVSLSCTIQHLFNILPTSSSCTIQHLFYMLIWVRQVYLIRKLPLYSVPSQVSLHIEQTPQLSLPLYPSTVICLHFFTQLSLPIPSTYPKTT